MVTLQNSSETDNREEWHYFLGGFILFSLVFSEMANLFLLIGIYTNRLYTVTAKVIVALTVTDMGLGIFVVLPSCITMVGNNWILQYSVCISQGFLAHTFLSANCFLMLFLALERFHLLLTKSKTKKFTDFCNGGIFAIFIFSGLLSGFPLLQMNNYLFIPGMFQCVLSSAPFPLLLNLLTYVIPMAAITFLSIMTLVKTTSCRRENRISVIPQVGDTLRTDRLTMARASLFRTSTSAGEEEEGIVIPKTEIRATIALSYLTAPLSLLYCCAFCLKSLSLYWIDIQETLAGICFVIYVVAIFIQPFILFGVSGVLRKSFINLIRRRNVEGTPAHVFRLIRRSPRPREEIDIGRGDIPTFLRQSSAMTIQAQISSQLNPDGNGMESRLSSPSSERSFKIQKSETRTPKRTQSLKSKMDMERRSSVQSGNAESLDSMLVNVGASVESRWSVSTASILTLNIPEIQMPCSRPRSRIARVMSETTHEKLKGNISPTNSFNSELLLKPSVSCINLSPSKIAHSRGNRNQYRSSLYEESRLNLPPVEDVSSKECSPKESKDIKSTPVIIPVTPRHSTVQSSSFVIRMDSQTDSLFCELDDAEL